MRKETTKERIVRTTTTGYIEADMLGHTLNVAEEMKAKQNKPQRPHSSKERTVHEVLMEGFRKEQLERDLEEELEEVSNGALRTLIRLKYKGKSILLWIRAAMRKDKLNG